MHESLHLKFLDMFIFSIYSLSDLDRNYRLRLRPFGMRAHNSEIGQLTGYYEPHGSYIERAIILNILRLVDRILWNGSLRFLMNWRAASIGRPLASTCTKAHAKCATAISSATFRPQESRDRG